MVPCALRAAQILLTVELTQRHFKHLVTVLCVATLLAFIGELSGSPAAFELHPDEWRNETLPSFGIKLRDHFQHPKPEPKRLNSEETQEKGLRSSGEEFAKTLKNNYSFFEKSSATKWFYLVAFVIQMLVMASIYVMLAWSIILYRSRDREYLRVRKRLIPSLLWMIVLAYPWLVMRRAFETYSAQIYDASSTASQATLAGLLFLLATFYLVAVSWKAVGKRFEPILAVVTSLGLTGLVFNEAWIEAIFPRHASPGHYLVLFAVVVLALGPLLIPISNGSTPDKA